MNEWQPIETAPKVEQGEALQILVCFEGQFRWVFFIANANGADTCAPGYAKPTHWMLLPDPPR